MKKTVFWAVACVLVVCPFLAGCGTGGEDSSADASSYIPYACVGDGECEVHYTEYHSIPGELVGLVTAEQIDEYEQTHTGKDLTIVNFVREMQIPKADFMRAMGITEENKDEYYPNTAIPDAIVAGDYVEAIYGGDAALTDRVFVRPEHVFERVSPSVRGKF